MEEGFRRSLLSYNKDHVNFDTFLVTKLAERQFERFVIEGDGHCQLNAVRHQLRFSNLSLPSVSVWRENISTAMMSNISGICRHFHISGREDVEELVEHINNFKYMRSARGVTEWGNEYTLYQIAEMYNLHITVLSPFRLDSGVMFLHEECVFAESNSYYKRIFLCRSNTSHYDSVVDTQCVEEDTVFCDEDTQFVDGYNNFVDVDLVDDSNLNGVDAARIEDDSMTDSDCEDGLRTKRPKKLENVCLITRNEKRCLKRKCNSAFLNAKR